MKRFEFLHDGVAGVARRAYENVSHIYASFAGQNTSPQAGRTNLGSVDDAADGQHVSSQPPSAGAAALELAWARSKPGLVAVGVFSVLINLLRLAVPLYIFQLLDRVISSRSIETLVMLGMIAVVALVACSIGELIRRWLLSGWGVWIEEHFGRRLFLAGLGSHASARPSAQLRDLEAIRQFLAGSTVPAWLDVVFVPFFVFVLYLVSPTIAWIVIFAMGLMLLLGLLNEHLTRSSRGAASKASEVRRDWLVTAERDAKAIGSYDISASLADQWHRSSVTRLRENRATRLVGLLTADGMRFIENLLRIVAYGVGVWLVIAGNLSVGGVIAAALLARLAAGNFRRAMGSWRNLAAAYTAYFRFRKHLVADIAEQRITTGSLGELSLHIDDIAYRYPEQTTTLFRHVSLDLDPGELLCVVGPSGAGKSTLARILSGHLAPRMGMVRLGEVDIMRLPAQQLSGMLGYLPQEAQTFRGTIRDNIAGVTSCSDEDVITAARLAAIHDRVVRLPLGYETEIGDGAAALSQGERQRIALARALLGKPSLLVLDEPEAHLDAGARQSLSEALVACKAAGAMVVVTSHSLDMIRIADKAIVLENSRGIVLNNRDELRKWRRQARQSRPRIVARSSGNSES